MCVWTKKRGSMNVGSMNVGFEGAIGDGEREKVGFNDKTAKRHRRGG